MVYDLGGDLVIQRPVDPEDSGHSDYDWTADLESIRDTTCLPSEDEEDGRTTVMTHHLSKKSSFTLDGVPFNFGRQKRKSPYMPSRSPLHIENAPSFTLDMLDESDPFESWDAGSRDSRHHSPYISDHSPYISTMERKYSISMQSMDKGKRKRWRKEPSKLRLSEVSSTLEIQNSNIGDEEDDSRSMEKSMRLQMEMNMPPVTSAQQELGMTRVVSL